MTELKPEASRTVMSVVEVAIQGSPLDVYFEYLVSSGLFFKVIAAVLDDNVRFSIIQTNAPGKFDCHFAIYQYSG